MRDMREGAHVFLLTLAAIHTGYFAHVGTPTLTTSAFRDSLGTLSAGDESSLGAGSGP